jgi:hypothetical protein
MCDFIEPGWYFIQNVFSKNFIGIAGNGEGSLVISMTNGGRYNEDTYTVSVTFILLVLREILTAN